MQLSNCKNKEEMADCLLYNVFQFSMVLGFFLRKRGNQLISRNVACLYNNCWTVFSYVQHSTTVSNRFSTTVTVLHLPVKIQSDLVDKILKKGGVLIKIYYSKISFLFLQMKKEEPCCVLKINFILVVGNQWAALSTTKKISSSVIWLWKKK